MKILVTGANGFLGSHCCRHALSRGHDVVAMTRGKSDLSLIADLLDAKRIERRTANLAHPVDLGHAAQGCDAIIHAAAATSEHGADISLSRTVNVAGTRSLLAAAREYKVGRVVYISSQSAHPGNRSPYGRSKLESEEVVKMCGLQWTILRPGVIYGPERRGVFAKLEQHIERLPVIPVIGNGRYLQFPVHVDDVAGAAVACLDSPRCASHLFELGGGESLPFREILDIVMECRGLNRRKVYLPVWVCRIIARVGKLVMKEPPLTLDNIEGLLTAPPLDNSAAKAAFGYAPRRFLEGYRACLAARAKAAPAKVAPATAAHATAAHAKADRAAKD